MSRDILIICVSDFVHGSLDRHRAEGGHRISGLTRKLTTEAAEVLDPIGALLLSPSSRSRDPRRLAEIGWSPTRLDLLSQLGEARLRALAVPNSQKGANP